MPLLPADGPLGALVWSALTVGLYALARALHRRRVPLWPSPLVATPALLAAALTLSGVGYQDYLAGTRWLLTLLGPAVVAFAVPIYDRLPLLARHFKALAVGVCVGSLTAIGSSWLLASLLSLPDGLRLSLLPRSLSTPFALIVSREIGGIPELTAVFVVVTGVLGAAIGRALLGVLPLTSPLSRGALFGMGAHAVGTAAAHEIDPELGAVAGVTMVLAGVVNVVAAPAVMWLLGG